VRDRGRWRLSVALALALGLVAAALAAPAGAAEGDPGAAPRAGKQSLQILAYFDGDTPVTGGRVRVYAGGRRLRELGDGPGPVKTFPGGIALLRFSSLPSRLRVVVSGGRAGGRPVRGSLKTKVRGVTDGEVVHVNPATTVTDVWAHAEEGRSHRRARNVIERTLGIRRILDDHDLYVTDQWFNGDRFHRWTLEQGSVGTGARALVQHIERPGFDRRVFRSGDGGGPNARAAACGGATAGTILTGLIDAANTGVGLSGPQGFAVSGVLLFVKEIINAGVSGGECGKDDVSTQLKGLSTQISQLEEKIDKQFLALRIAAVKPLVTDIAATQEKFGIVAMWAAKAENKDLPAEDRKEASDAFPNSMKTFMQSADNLVNHNVRNHLHEALITEQRGGTGTPQNPVEGPALIPAVRKEIGKERFFTNGSSRRLRQFFSYYEWAQTELATVMTEFYTAGGPTCVTASTNCKKDSGNAKLQVNTIKANIAAQERAMPKPIDERVFIDTKTNLMWGVEPQYRPAAHIPGYGIICRAQAPISRDCVSAELTSFPNPNQFFTIVPPSLPGVVPASTSNPTGTGPVSWSVPAVAQLQNLLAQRGQGEDPVAWLKNTFGVSFDLRVGDPTGYRPDRLTHRISLWARDGFQWTYRRSNVFSKWHLNPTAQQLLLVPCQGGRCVRGGRNLGPLDLDQVSVAHDCLEPASFLRPDKLTGRDCVAEPSTGGFILFLRGTTATERGQYW
jgi:hypothetical protein